MKPIYLILIMLLLSGIASAQLEPDRERFDIEIHPGEVIHKVLTLTNTGEEPVSRIRTTAVGGDAKDMIMIDIPKKAIDPGDDMDVDIFFMAPPETKPGLYTGFFYIFDETAPPALPIAISFNLNVIEKDSYNVGLYINDAKEVSGEVTPDEPVEFDLEVRNTGRFRDLIEVYIPEVPAGWQPRLYDGDEEIDLPYSLALPSGSSHHLTLKVEVNENARSGSMRIVGESQGNRSKNASVTVNLDVGVVVKGYDVRIDIPKQVIVNRSYEGRITLFLENNVRVMVDAISDPSLLIVPSSMVLDIDGKFGSANFTLIATEPSGYAIVFRMVDTNGVPFPPEVVYLEAVEPSGLAVITSADPRYMAVASLLSGNNTTVPVIQVEDRVSKDIMDMLLPYSDVIILGSESEVSSKIESELSGFNVSRIAGSDLAETSWILADKMWSNQTAVVVSGPSEIDVFRSYQIAKRSGLPLVVCGDELTDSITTSIKSMMAKGLEKAIIASGVSDSVVTSLKVMGLSVEVS
ncbi:MAG: hypothetical protein H5T42_05150 [Methanothrix sp.]|jgi:hypothetical protein|uniref:Cell wall binding repeat 2-containing protein n=2 Tax=Methanothrix TaxID=2222 RepID=A0B5K8_METTP|nr:MULTISPECIES: hypothetical protein [Methanothrix]ABK13982.1 hypothetical protein Mthe_0183 [Methanothrix thermoacetophila PT]MBC7079841.1 hypothetical protein [Methanothrix sp.]NPU87992.1 hypothetical protein [Methanothrix sp.]